MRKWLFIVVPAGVMVLVSCATLPKETVEMSRLLQKQITALEKVSIELAVCCVASDSTQSADSLLLEELHKQFALAQLMNETITLNLESFYEVREKRKALFQLLKKTNSLTKP